MSTVTITIAGPANESYDVIIEPGALAQLPDMVTNGDYDQCFVLYDANLESVAQNVAEMTNAALIKVEPGEASKCFAEVERLCGELLERGATRRSLVINVGGGMLTDLGGFVASIYMRGIDFIHVPTSLLGMVDASIGGKSGIDLNGTKNSVGNYAHPIAILIDTDVLSTLPDEALREGLVEVIKMAAVLNAEHFAWLEENLAATLDRDEDVLRQCITIAAEMKAGVVGGDERDAGQRQLLNFGHTVGHAVEALSQYTISHGQAVSIGMVKEMAMAQTVEADRITAYLQQLDMPIAIPGDMSVEQLWEIMQNDKKNVGDEVRTAVATDIGTGEVQTITLDQFSNVCHG